MKISAEIKRRVSCIDACQKYGIDIDRHGFARCPFHHEKTASFKVYSGDRGYFCYGCHASGSVIDLVMKLFDVSAGDACRRLSDDFRLGLYQEDNSSRSKRIAQNREAWALRKREKEQKKIYRGLVDEWNDSIRNLRLVNLLFYETAPKTPDEEWSEWFAIALREKEAAGLRADQALQALAEYEKQRFAS